MLCAKSNTEYSCVGGSQLFFEIRNKLVGVGQWILVVVAERGLFRDLEVNDGSAELIIVRHYPVVVKEELARIPGINWDPRARSL